MGRRVAGSSGATTGLVEALVRKQPDTLGQKAATLGISPRTLQRYMAERWVSAPCSICDRVIESYGGADALSVVLVEKGLESEVGSGLHAFLRAMVDELLPTLVEIDGRNFQLTGSHGATMAQKLSKAMLQVVERVDRAAAEELGRAL
jgi:hypothetical protein